MPKKAQKITFEEVGTVNPVEVKLTDEQIAANVRVQAREAYGDIDKGYLKLAEALFNIKHKEYYRSWGIDTFTTYCEVELGIKYGKANALTQIWDKVKSLSLDTQEIEELGWSKVSLLCAHLTDENHDELLGMAKKNTYTELSKTMTRTGYSHRAVGENGTLIIKIPLGTSSANTVNEVIEIAKRVFETEDVTTALTLVVQEWMQYSGNDPEKLPLGEFLGNAERIYGEDNLKRFYRERLGVKEEVIEDDDFLDLDEITDNRVRA